MNDNNLEQKERDDFVHKFEAWTSQDQVEFVERLLGKMAHCQHRRIDAALQPMLERDFIHSTSLTDSIKSCYEKWSLGGSGSDSPVDPDPLFGSSPLGSSLSHNPHHTYAHTNHTTTTTTNHLSGNHHNNNNNINNNNISNNLNHHNHHHNNHLNNTDSLNNNNSNLNHNHLNHHHVHHHATLAQLDAASHPLVGSHPLNPAPGAESHHLSQFHNSITSAGPIGAHHHHHNHQSAIGTTSPHITDPLLDLSAKLINSATLLPIKSQCKRQKMIYHCKFGEFGVLEGQFTEPSGVAVNAQNDIIVADTNNHRIQIFDNEGRFKFQFGECGKRDGQLLYPNRVAVVKSSGDIIVTERSPTHQIQIYTQYGQFVRKFGANILQHPRGVTVDNKGRIIVVECKVMRVIIFDQMGNALHKFGCSKHLEFPNGVVVNDKQEIFISDNRAHCVKVFSYEGQFLRQIGGEGLTNYPIGVCINDAGEILVADNHNNFNITIFNQDGNLISALESKVKHAQCFDVALMDDNSVVLASKDYRIYIYRYLQMQALTSMTTFD